MISLFLIPLNCLPLPLTHLPASSHRFPLYHLFFFFFFFFKDFIYLFDREKSQVDGEAGREREGSGLPAEQRARCGTRSQDPEIMTWAEGSGPTHWATQAPLICSSVGLFFPLCSFVLFLKFHMWVKSYGVCLSLTDLLHSAQYPLVPSLSLQMPSSGWIIFRALYRPARLLPFIYGGHLGCFRILATVNNATINIRGVCLFPN